MGEQRIGVLLFNLGGPETMADVRPFLFNLFSDPDIIKIPFSPLRKPVAWYIAKRRSKKSGVYYEKIGGGSPLRRITDEQAQALRGALWHQGVEAKVYVGMRYWHPLIEEALEEIRRDGITHLVVLPLYPQFSVSTTKSSLARMNELMDEHGRPERISIINNWHDEPQYIEALADTLKREIPKFADQDPARIHILFSAHSVPVSYIKNGDPYLDQIQATVRLVMDQLPAGHPHSLAFQSKVGPVEWLSPPTDVKIRELAAQGVTQMLLVPVSFVSEHIETLYELDILYRAAADEAKVASYRRAEAMNCDQKFIDSLAGLVLRELAVPAASKP